MTHTPHDIRPFLRVGALVLTALWASVAGAETFPLPPPDQDVIGEIRTTKARQEDTLLDIARAFDLGYQEIIHANPTVDRWLPGKDTQVVLPTRFILPDAPRDGIVLNLPEMRLYYYPKPRPGEPAVVITHPVSIGRMNWRTPLGTTQVVRKEKDPPWYPPASIRAEHAAKGDPLPDVVPGGPGNPLGLFALRLGIPGYLIHGTNKEYGIGMRVSHGCVRLYPEDIESLYQEVPVGTRVHIINQPVKLGRLNGVLYLESHPPLEEDRTGDSDTTDRVLAIAANAEQLGTEAVPSTIQVVLHQADGIPTRIDR